MSLKRRFIRWFICRRVGHAYTTHHFHFQSNERPFVSSSSVDICNRCGRSKIHVPDTSGTKTDPELWVSV